MRARIRTQRIARSNRHQLASITFLPALITGWCSTAACSAPAGPNAGTGHQPKISRGERTLCASTLLPITAEGRVMLPRSPHGPAKQIQHADRYRAAECHVRIGEGSRQRLSAQRVGAGRLAVSSFITRGESDRDGANDVPWTRCRSASCCDGSRHPGRSIRIQSQQMFATRFQIKLHPQQWARALRPRRARPANNSFTELKFNQAWLSES